MCVPVQVLNEKTRKIQVENIAAHLKDAQEFLQKRAVNNFGLADPEYGRMLQEALDKYKKGPKVSNTRYKIGRELKCVKYVKVWT